MGILGFINDGIIDGVGALAFLGKPSIVILHFRSLMNANK
jgi:hypothetical protein